MHSDAQNAHNQFLKHTANRPGNALNDRQALTGNVKITARPKRPGGPVNCRTFSAWEKTQRGVK